MVPLSTMEVVVAGADIVGDRVVGAAVVVACEVPLVTA